MWRHQLGCVQVHVVLSFDQHLLQLVRGGQVDEETALQYASSPTDLKLKLEGF